jgi:phosphate transport system protein
MRENQAGVKPLPRIHFHQQLDDLKNKLLSMAALAQQAAESSVEAYIQRDRGLCEYVWENEAAINLAHREVDEMAYELLAKEQPMAVDLRFLLAVIKINGDLERIGDQSMSIAQRTIDLLDTDAIHLPVDIEGMGNYAGKMIRKAIQSLLDADALVAESVIEMDDEIDRMNRMAHEDLTDVMVQRPESSLQTLNAIVIARNLERIADHATNIAMDVIFWVRGADVRHQITLAAD